jgi:hypothetical protein
VNVRLTAPDVLPQQIGSFVEQRFGETRTSQTR